MSKFELIDDYLTNRLSEGDKVAFEQQLASDPSLKADVDLQRNILEGIKKARAIELKTMLNNVPLTGLNGGFSAGKIAATLATVGLVSTALYFYLTADNTSESVVPQDEVVNTEAAQPENPESQPDANSAGDVKDEVKEDNAPQADKNAAAASEDKKKKDVKTPVVADNKPKIEVIDPTEDLPVENEARDAKTEGVKPLSITSSHIAVETDSSSKKYNFHYQFKDGKLMLYGSFDKSLYEILEISGDSRTVFLYFKENYYLLDVNQDKVTALQPIRDSALIKKLNEYQHQ